MTVANMFVRKVIWVYVSWPSQVILYLSVFIIATGTALLLDMYFGVRPEIVVLSVSAFILVLLLAGPPSFVALRLRRAASIQTRRKIKHDEPATVGLSTRATGINFERQAEALLTRWHNKTEVLGSWNVRLLNEFTDRQLTLLLLNLLWEFHLGLREQVDEIKRTGRLTSKEYVRGFEDSLDFVISVFVTELNELNQQSTKRGSSLDNAAREEHNEPVE